MAYDLYNRRASCLSQPEHETENFMAVPFHKLFRLLIIDGAVYENRDLQCKTAFAHAWAISCLLEREKRNRLPAGTEGR